jgi:P pilus assembly chaperone PapD
MRLVTALLAAFLLAGAPPPPLSAQEFMLSPGTIVFEGRARAGELYVKNTADRLATFRVEPVAFVMGPEGNLAEVPLEELPASAAEIVRFSPRQFQLRPEQVQTIRLGLRKPRDLSPGEYRVHLRVRQLPETRRDSIFEDEDVSDRGLNVRIPISVARAVRVIVRHEVPPAAARVTGISAQRNGDVVIVRAELASDGSASAGGRYAIIGSAAEAATEAGQIFVYADTPRRAFVTNIRAEALAGSGSVCMLYTDDRLRETSRTCAPVTGG